MPELNSMLPGHEDRELPEAPHQRATPRDVFIYPRVDTWSDRVWNMLSDIVTEDVTADFAHNPPEYVVSDDLSWLDDIIFDCTVVFSEIKATTADRLKEEFRAFRAAHATRTDDLSPIYREGLRIPSNIEIENKARHLFMNGQYPNLNEQRLEAAIRDLNEGHWPYRTDQTPRLYLCADERDFLTKPGNSGHYLDFGSEYLFNLAIRLVGDHEAKRVLRSVGRPTMVLVDIPMATLHSSTLQEFAGSILEYLFCDLVEGLDAHALGPGAGSAITLHAELPKETVIGHYHPKLFYHSHQ